MSKTISGLPIAETLTGDELLPVVQDGNTVQATVEQVVALVGNTATWGNIEGTLSDQTDLQTALDNKYSTSNPAGYITASALTGYAPLNSPTFTGTVGGITKSMVGLGNVDNTADANKSVNYANTAGSASNSDTVDGYHIQVDGTGTNPNTIYFKTTGGVDPSQAIWGDITGSIVDQTDLYNALVNGTYATGNWNINASSVDGYSVQVDGTGTDPNTIYFKTTGGTISVDWDDVANTPTTVSGYGITDAVTTSGNQTIGGTKTFSSTITGSITGNADTVDGYNVQVDGTGTDPNTIYFKTTGGTISVDWDNVLNTPTTVAGYGITDVFTETESDARFLGISATAVNSDKIDGYHVQVDGTGTDPNTIYFKTTGGTTSVAWGDISGTLSDQTDLQTALNGKVPYTGATGNVNLGEYGLTSGFLQADLTPTNALQVGRMQWNDADGTMDLRLKGNNVTLQIGQEQLIRVVNKTGADLLEANYQCVKISGAQGQRPKVALAQANNDANSSDTIGLVTETIANNQEGFVTDSGMVTNINTTGSLQGETWADGDVLYLSGTVAGRLTNIKPQAPIHTVIVGFVIYAHNNQGKIYVKVDNGYELNELHNVRINGVTDGQVLAYDSTLSVWENINQSAITSGNSDKVDGYHVQVDGTGTDPNTIYFKTTGGGIGVDWDDISNTPTTVAGYGITDAVTTSGNQTIGGTKTFSSTITGSITGNAGTVTNGVYTTGDQTIGGTKTFSSTISGSVSGNAGTVTNGVYTTGDQTIGGTKTFTNDIVGTTLRTSANTALTLNLQAGTAFNTGGSAIALRGSTTGYNNNGMEFYAGNSERMRLDSAGNLGVGLTNPSDFGKLAVRGTIAPTSADGQTQGVFLADNTGKVIVGGYNNSATNFIAFNAGGGTERMRLDSAGNLGLGVTPSAWSNVAGTRVLQIGDYGAYLFGCGSGWSANPFTYLGNNAYHSGGAWRYYSSLPSAQYLQSANQHIWNIAGSGTAGNAISFTQAMTLDANATLYTDGGTGKGRVTIQNASANNDILSTTTGFGAYNPLRLIASEVRFESGSSPEERMRITSAGNVGIGTTSPTFRLVSANSSTDGGWLYSTGTVSILGLGGYSGATDGAFSLRYDRSNGNITFNGGNRDTPTERMRIDGSGNVGIGGTPDYKLDVFSGALRVNGNAKGVAGDASIFFGSTTNNYIYAGNANNIMAFGTNGAERIRLDNVGNVGIGTSSPDGKLMVVTTGAYNGSVASRTAIQLDNTNTTGGFTNSRIQWTWGGVGVGVKGYIEGGTYGSDYLGFGFNTTERMRITDAGKVLVGAGATASLGKLVVSEASSGTAVIALESQGSWNSQISSTSTGNMIFSNGTNERMRINASGDVGIGTSSPSQKLEVGGSILASGNVTAYSDIRVKDNVESIEGAIGKLNQIRGVTYTRTDLDDKQRRFAGVIAQEIEQVLPEAVFDNGRVKAVDYNATIALLIEAVKEQQGQINELKLTIEQLKGN